MAKARLASAIFWGVTNALIVAALPLCVFGFVFGALGETSPHKPENLFFKFVAYGSISLPILALIGLFLKPVRTLAIPAAFVVILGNTSAWFGFPHFDEKNEPPTLPHAYCADRDNFNLPECTPVK